MNLARVHPDPLADALPPLLIDRQRVVHSSAFRRLQLKTQVFVAPLSDHFRTRLTHTLEVAHQSRAIALMLSLDADLAEVVALAHDLGHPPFGHAGERALDECLADHGGFEHNRHTLRIVEEIEHPYPEFYGLNLTHVVRECLAKHSTQYDRPGAHPLQDGQLAPAESAAVDIADRLTYALHDLQDGLYAGLIDPASLAALELWQACHEGPALDEPDAWRGQLRPTVDRIQARVLDDLRAQADADQPVRLSNALDAQLNAIDAFLYDSVYRSEALIAADAQARVTLRSVFDALVSRPERLPRRFQRRLETQDVFDIVGDYVAGMTDRYCLDEHARLCDA